MSKKLSKSDILLGKDLEVVMHIPELEGDLILHPLTEKQYVQVMAIQSGGAKMKGAPVYGVDGNIDKEASMSSMSMEIDLEDSMLREFEANATAVAFSLSSNKPGGEHWTVDEVMEIRIPGLVERIAKKIMEISAFEDKEVESFRNELGRADDSVSTFTRNAPVDESGEPDPLSS